MVFTFKTLHGDTAMNPAGETYPIYAEASRDGPGKNLVRDHGVLAPNARDRAQVVPSARPPGDDGGASPRAPVAPAL